MWLRLRLTPIGERKQDTHHEDWTRANLLGDRRTRVGCGLGVWKQRGRSTAVATRIVIAERTNDQPVTDVTV